MDADGQIVRPLPRMAFSFEIATGNRRNLEYISPLVEQRHR